LPAADNLRRMVRQATRQPRAALRGLWSGPGSGWHAEVVGVVNRCRRDRREPHRTPPLFQRLRREGPKGCRATMSATQRQLALQCRQRAAAGEAIRREGEG
jgi:hypothetical protein